jgi:hypothetical protein
MSRRCLTLLALLASHVAVAFLTWLITWNLLHTPLNAPEAAKKKDTAASASSEQAFDRYVHEMQALEIKEPDVRAELLAALRAWAALPPDDQALLLDSDPADDSRQQLLSLTSVKAFLDELSRGKDPGPVYFVSPEHRPAVLHLYEGAKQTLQRTLGLRKQVHEAATAFLSLRAVAVRMPALELDNRLRLLDLIRSAGAEHFTDVKAWREPRLPLFTDRDGIALAALERWLCSRQAQMALPIEKYRRAYHDGKVVVFSPAFVTYLEPITDAIKAERTMAQSTFPGHSAVLASAYDGLQQVFVTFARTSKPR